MKITQVIEFRNAANPVLTYDKQHESFLLSGELDTNNTDTEGLSKDYRLSYMKILTDRANRGK